MENPWVHHVLEQAMTDNLLGVFRKVRKCVCGCEGLELMPHDGDSVYIAPYGVDTGRDPEKFVRITEMMHPIVIEELWNIKEAFLE
jgi:hypothetical protein